MKIFIVKISIENLYGSNNEYFILKFSMYFQIWPDGVKSANIVRMGYNFTENRVKQEKPDFSIYFTEKNCKSVKKPDFVKSLKLVVLYFKVIVITRL